MNEQQIRIDLAAAFRLIAHMDMHEAVANHLSATISDDGKTFLMNRRWMHFADVTASNLQVLNSDDDSIMHTREAPDPSAWAIHGQVHGAVPEAKVILHAHPSYATALATLKDPTIYPIDNNTCRFYKRIAYDLDFGGIAVNEQEGERIANTFKGMRAVMMGNHGVSVIGDTVAEAFDQLYYLEKACKTMVLAYSTGQPLSILSPELAEQTAQSWQEFAGAADKHFDYLKSWLDQTDPTYRQ